jgi:transposase
LVRGGEKLSSEGRTLGVSAQSLDNWVKAEASGRLGDVRGKALTAEQMEIARLKAELSRVRVERDILKKRRHTSRGSRCEVCLCRARSWHLADRGPVPGFAGQRQRLPSTPIATSWRCWPEPAGCSAGPPAQRYGLGGAHQGGLRRDERRLWLAADMARACRARHSCGQGAGAQDDEVAGPASPWQAAFQGHHEQRA